MRVTIKILRAVLALLLCVVILFNLWMLFQQLVLKRDTPQLFGYSQYVVTSGSMEPTFSVGDLILVRAEDSYGPGDVVTFTQGGSVVTHRIVGSVDGSFITRGDANNTEDSDLLSPSRIVGRLQVILPGAGSVIAFLRSPLGLLILLTVGFLLIKLPDWLGGLQKEPKGKHQA